MRDLHPHYMQKRQPPTKKEQSPAREKSNRAWAYAKEHKSIHTPLLP